MRKVYVLLTMDCETARTDVTPYAAQVSGSGPIDYRESERSIRGYVETAAAHGFPTTLFAHPEVALGNAELLLALEEQGACLGLHLHPYKLKGQKYRCDLGAYSASEQREILHDAMPVWESALGKAPRYFRGGYFSAHDSTYRVLHGLGFRGGSFPIQGVSCLPTAAYGPVQNRIPIGRISGFGSLEGRVILSMCRYPALLADP